MYCEILQTSTLSDRSACLTNWLLAQQGARALMCHSKKIVRLCVLCFRKGDRIYEQLKCLGASLDWSREMFTLDPVSYWIQISIP